MAKSKQQKKDLLQSLKDKIEKMKSVVFVNFKGLGVNENEELRAKCRENGAEFLVAKKTVLSKVLKDEGYDAGEMEGEVAAVFGYEDEIAPAKLIREFGKDHEQVQPIMGILENNIIDLEKVNALALLPSRDELVAKAVGSIAAPLSGFVNVLHGNLRNLVYVLNAVRESKE